MKKIIFAIAVILMLTACGVDAETNPENEGNLSAPSSESEIKEEEPPKTEPMSIDEQRLRDRAALSFEIFGWDKTFEQKGISVNFENIEFSEDWYYSAELVLKKDGKELRIPYEGIYDYNEENKMALENFGSFNFFAGDSAVFCGNERAVFFDTKTLEKWDTEIEFPKTDADDLWVNAASYDSSKEQYIIVATKFDYRETKKRTTFLFIHDKDGKCIYEKSTKLRGSYEFDGNYFPCVIERTFVFEFEGEKFVMDGNSFESLESDKRYNCSLLKKTGYEDYSLELYTYYEDSYRNDEIIAFLYKGSKLMGQLAFHETNFSYFYDEYDMPVLDVSPDGKSAKYYSDYFAMTLELDFESGKHSLSYNPTDRHISEEYSGETSADGKYSIAYFGETFGGDAFSCHYAIRNNETGEYRYLGNQGGMWGGYGGRGFLKNSDVYSYSTHELKIIDPETGKIKFDINKNFPLGYDEETDSERGILTFRRNPEDFTYIIVYYEYENGSESIEVDENEFGGYHYEWDFNYKIGFLDAEGNLIESYDTGVPFISNHFGINEVDMRYSEKELTIIVRGGKAISGFIGTFDLSTHEFKVSPLEE